MPKARKKNTSESANIPPHNHPLRTQQYAIFTPAIDRLVNQVAKWIEQQKTGAYIYGPSRFGKSRAVKFFLEEMLAERFQNHLPLVIWIRTHVLATAGGFYSEILKAGHHPYWENKRTPTKKIDLIVSMLTAMADQAEGNFVAILIDEAQTMTNKEWMWLMGIQNLLDDAGYRLSVISIGSHQMGYVHQIQAMTGNAHIAARFLATAAQYISINSEQELGFVLNGYDQDSEWPDGSGISFTMAFAGNDRRLADHAKTVWNSMIRHFPDDFGGEYEMPMLHISLAVETLLMQVNAGQDWEDAMSETSWFNTFLENGFHDHMRLVSAMAPRRRR